MSRDNGVWERRRNAIVKNKRMVKLKDKEKVKVKPCKTVIIEEEPPPAPQDSGKQLADVRVVFLSGCFLNPPAVFVSLAAQQLLPAVTPSAVIGESCVVPLLFLLP